MTTTPQPPHNIEAERATLAGALLDPDRLDVVTDIVSGGDWYDAAHRRIWAAVLALHARGSGVDSVTVGDELRTRRDHVAADEDYILELTSSIPVVAHIAKHAKIVRDRAQQRAMIDTARLIAARGYDAADVDAYVDEAEASVLAVSQAMRAQETCLPLRELVRTSYAEIEQRQRDGGIGGTATGYRVLDAMTSGLYAGDLVVVAGRPSMGKTAFALGIARHVAEHVGPVMVFSLEMPKEQLTRRLQAMEGRIHGKLLRNGRLSASDWSKLSDATARLAALPLHIDDAAGLTPRQVRARCRRIRASEGGLALIAIDYLQLLNPERRNPNRERDVAEMSKACKELAKEMGCPVVLLAQLNREVERERDKRPQMRHLRESGAIEQDADVIAFLYRDAAYNPETLDRNVAEVIIAKQRAGPVGTVRLAFFPEFTRFDNLAEEGWVDSDDFADDVSAPQRGIDWDERAREAAAGGAS